MGIAKDKLKILEKEFEEKELKHTCFDSLKELVEDRTLVFVNAPRALIACELLGRWQGFLKGFERGLLEEKSEKHPPFEQGRRTHVESWVGRIQLDGSISSITICSEPDCELNKVLEGSNGKGNDNTTI